MLENRRCRMVWQSDDKLGISLIALSLAKDTCNNKRIDRVACCGAVTQA